MQFRSEETLRRWVDDTEEGHDTGLVVVPLADASTTIFMQPAEPGHHRWRIALEPRHDTAVLDHHRMNALAMELLVTAELCAYLEARSVGHTEELLSEAP